MVDRAPPKPAKQHRLRARAMPELVQPVPLPVPPALQPWIAFDVGFEVLLCVRPECRYAVSPSSLSQHLRQKHKANTQLQQEATRYAQQFLTVSSDYDFRTMPLPLGGGLPLPFYKATRQTTRFGSGR